MSWDPAQYLKFSDHRLRPGIELMARVSHEAPATIVDLGCGIGELTGMLAARWPNARVTGVDNSPEMLAKAKFVDADANAGQIDHAIVWVEKKIEDWVSASRDKPRVDLIYSNAALHWVDNHAELFPRLVECLSPGGCLAVQMPLSWHAPSHRLMREVLASGAPDGGSIGPPELRASLAEPPVMDGAAYHALLDRSTSVVDIWSTEYVQVLDRRTPSSNETDEAHEAGPSHPVLEWVRSTGLRPVLAGLDDADRARFLEVYRSRLAKAYPVDADGRTVYPFPRLFIVAVR